MPVKLHFSFLFLLVLSLASVGYGEPGTIMLDFDKTGDVNTEPGFTSFLISDSGTTVNGIAIDLAGDINDARRANPNSGSGIPVYTEEIYRDFIYGVSPSGVTITLWGLGANQQCDITIYAFDDDSSPNRISDWSANGDYLLTTDFIGGDGFRWPSPWWGIDYKFGPETATADEYGRIALTSTRNPSSPEGEDFAFVNALVAVPKGAYIPVPYAQHPSPSNSGEDIPINVNLQWGEGAYADTHDVYFGADFNDVNDANRSNPLDVLASQDHSTTTYDPPASLDTGTTYYWRIDEVNDANIWKGEVWSFITHVPFLIASQPVPLDGAIAVPIDVNLTWEKGEYAVKHDVYLGTDFNDVNDANRSNPLSVLVSENQSTATYDPPASLYQSTTYYWRIDEVNDTNIWKGEVWSFRTTGPYFGQKPPGMEPELFAPGLFPFPDGAFWGGTFSPDGNEFYYTVSDRPSYTYAEIRYTAMDSNGHWSTPAVASFSGTYLDFFARFSPDGQQMIFSSGRPPGDGWNFDLFRVERIGRGWSSVIHLPVSNPLESDHAAPCSMDGTLYYHVARRNPTRSTVYRSEPNYSTAELFDVEINDEYEPGMPGIAPDESYMVFPSSYETGVDNADDLYVTFNRDGGWTSPRKLGNQINTSSRDWLPFVSPKGEFLFFNSGEYLFWVDIRAIYAVGDFTYDGIVNFEDFAVLAAHWLTNEPSVDIAPETPDGIVDFLDLQVFVQHWLEN